METAQVREATQAEKQQAMGKYIREHREAAGYSLRRFSGMMKLSPSYVSDVELGRRTLADRKMREIAELLKGSLFHTEDELYNSMLMLSGSMSQERMALLAILEIVEDCNTSDDFRRSSIEDITRQGLGISTESPA